MSPSPRAVELRQNMRRCLVDGTAFSVMVGAGETYLAAFVLALGMGQLTAGLVASVPMLAGGIIQMVAPSMVRRMGSHRRWVVLCAATQAVTFVPLVIAALVNHIPVYAIFIIASLYWGAGMAGGGAWNTWIGTLIPKPIRANYFARRSRWLHLAVLASVVGGGIALQVGSQRGNALTAFALLFSVAALMRGISTWYLHRQTEPVKPSRAHRQVPIREMLTRLRNGHDGRLLLYMLVVQAAVQISGPFFTPYMLGNLKMSYATYLLLIATAYSARILTLPMLGALVERIGGKRVLRFSGACMIPLSCLWLISDNPAWLFLVQLAAGAVWAAYELATFLLLFETIPEEERTSVLTTYNLGYSIATVGGAALGGWILTHFGTDHTAYMMVFAASGIARLLTLALLGRAVRSVTDASMPEHPIRVPTGSMAVRPNLGSMEDPILPGLPRPGSDAS